MWINEKPLEPWLIVCSDGTVQAPHCTCMAGLSEGCSHIAAVIFTLEHVSRISKEASITDVPAYWLFPTPAKLAQPFQRIRDIDLRSASNKRKLQDTTDTIEATISAPVAAGPSSSLESFFAALNDSKQKHTKTGVTHTPRLV